MSSSSSSPGARAFRRRNEARLELVMNTALAVVRRYNREARNARAARRRLLAHCERFSIEEEELRVHKAKEAGLHNDLSVHMWEWRLRNPDAWLQWANHVSISGNCTDSKTRRFQIALWYTLGVPENVIKALQNLVLHYYNELLIDHELLTLQVDFGDVPVPEESFADDDTWARLMSFDIPFGSDYEGEALENGFSDHIPKGEGIDMLKHMMANFEARKIRIAHCHIDQFSPLMGMFHEWYQTAYDIVTNLPDTPRNLKAAREEAIERLDNYFRRAPGFQRDDLGLDHPVDEDAWAHLLSIGLT